MARLEEAIQWVIVRDSGGRIKSLLRRAGDWSSRESVRRCEVTSQIFCNLSELCLLARSFLLHGQISSAVDPLLVDVHQDSSDQSDEGFLIREQPHDPGPPFEFPVDPLHHVGCSDPFPVFFGECHITHEPWKESLDDTGCFPVSPGIQVIGEFLHVSGVLPEAVPRKSPDCLLQREEKPLPPCFQGGATAKPYVFPSLIRPCNPNFSDVSSVVAVWVYMNGRVQAPREFVPEPHYREGDTSSPGGETPDGKPFHPLCPGYGLDGRYPGCKNMG